jgi:hypothetical protein
MRGQAPLIADPGVLPRWCPRREVVTRGDDMPRHASPKRLLGQVLIDAEDSPQRYGRFCATRS